MSAPSDLPEGKIYLGSYLLERLVELGVKPIFGVPGDFNLTFLDLVEDHKEIEWVGCCNELNAAYAADGYARVKQAQMSLEIDLGTEKKTQGGVRGLGCLLTTFGVGELSAVNGVAGAYSERVPVLHIVGVPSTKLQKQGALLHHTLGDGRFNVFEHMSKGITSAQASLKSADNACDEIDRVLRAALTTARPTYLTLPTDLVFAPVSSSQLKTPLIPPMPLSLENEEITPTGKEISPEQQEMTDFVVDEIKRMWDKAKNPVILVDACAIRYGVTHLVKDLVQQTSVKYFSTPMGKGALPEDSAQGFSGVYIGAISDKDVKAAFESADLTLTIGSLKSDFNTGEFSYKIKTTQLIELHSDKAVVQYAQYPDITFHTLLPKLSKVLKPKSKYTEGPQHAGLAHEIPSGPSDKVITQEAFWPMWGKFFKPNDVIVVETGTSSFGMIDVPLPIGGTFVGQTLWGSIGWAGGATLGALMAAKEASTPEPRRTILFIGDGSLQLTVQEIATMLRQKLKPILVILNNDGYVIERLIHGPDRVYNDISRWKWQELMSFFNADNIPHQNWLAKNREEFESILKNKDFIACDKCQLLEVMMDRIDAPRALVEQAKMSAELNAA